MIKTNVYRCPEGCTRQTAADMEKLGARCCTHELHWKKVPNSRVDVRLSSDPPGTPLLQPMPDQED